MFGIRKKQTVKAPESPARTPPGELESLAAGHNDFALTLYNRLRPRAGNFVFSPFSVRTALAMAQAGARGETATQMAEVLRLSTSEEPLSAVLRGVVHRFNSEGGGRQELAVANSLWGQDGAELRAEYLDLIATRHAGEVKLVDFRGDPGRACADINQWVEDKTKRRIRALLPPGGLDADTRLVLANAVYFKGRWVLPFRKTLTKDQRFHLEGSGAVKAPLMHQQATVRYLKADGYQTVDLDYEHHDLSMLVILPDRKDGLSELESGLSAREIDDCVMRTRSCEVKLFLPRFKVSWETFDLSDLLAALGMPLAFDRGRADFSAINGHRPPHEEALFISAVCHKALAEVNEEGTEAAAVTAVPMQPLAARGFVKPPRVPVFRADHPFLFAVRDRNTGTLLFLGRVSDPTRED